MPFMSDNMTENLKELLRQNKIKGEPTLYYSLSNSQGDGVCFIGSFEWKNYKVYIKHVGHYYHSNSVSIDIETRFGNPAKEDIETEFKSLFKSICSQMEKYGYEIIDGAYDEKNIIDNMESNEYQFFENGDMAR